MKPARMTPDLLEIVAERFKALGEPARLQILNVLRSGGRTVTELVDETGLNQANVSKHLRQLYIMGFVTRRKSGLFVHYALADRDVFRLCDIMCGRLDMEAKARRRVLAGTAGG